PITLSQRASVTLAVGGNITTYKLPRGARVLTWTPPADLAPGTYPVQIATSNYAGKKQTFNLAPIVVGWETEPPTITAASIDPTTMALNWQADDPGTPWLALAVDYLDP